jgi:hypothetical protein
MVIPKADRADGARLIGERAAGGVPNPPGCVGRKLAHVLQCESPEIALLVVLRLIAVRSNRGVAAGKSETDPTLDDGEQLPDFGITIDCSCSSGGTEIAEHGGTAKGAAVHNGRGRFSSPAKAARAVR